MLNKEIAETVIKKLQTQSMEDKLRAIAEAREIFRDAFSGPMTEEDIAYSVHVYETVYNLVRDALGIEQLRIKADLGLSVKKVKPAKGTKASKSSKPAGLDPTAFMEAMKAKIEEMKKNNGK